MINMMYLVLTALLALNVSKEILDSFVTVNTGLEITKLTLSEKMASTYGQFGQLAQENREKYGAAFDAASDVQRTADELFNYIDTIKARVIAGTDKLPMDSVVLKDAKGRPMIRPLDLAKGKDNYTVLTNMMGMGDPGKPAEVEYGAVELRTKLEAFRDKLMAVAKDNPLLVENINKMFQFEGMKDSGGKPVSWEALNFYHVPLAAGVTILSKIQMDIRNAENELVNWMMGEVEGASFKFNTLTAIVKPQSSYVTVGSTYEADIFLGAYDNQNAPEVYIAAPGASVDFERKRIIGDSIRLEMDGAMAKLKQTASGAGLRNVQGIIRFKPVGGELQVEPFETSYEVAQPNLVVSPTKMNVFYRGVDNPISISVSGYSDKDIQPTPTNGELKKGAEGYIFRPGSGTEATIGATVTNPDGTKKSMPPMKFRVRTVPDPVPYFANKTFRDDKVSKTDLSAALGVIAKMENFDFDLRFEVIEFTIGTTVSGNYRELTSKSNRVTGDMQEMLRNAKPNQRFFIERIKVKGPDGTQRTLPPISLKVT